MLYLVALLCPPLAILLCGKPFQAMICIPLSCTYFPAALLAMLTVSNHKADKRAAKHAEEQLAAVRRQTASIDRLVKIQEAAFFSQIPVVPILPDPPPIPIPSPTPKPPLITRASVAASFAAAKDGILLAKSEAIRAYINLPEWAQPITWGLAAGTALSIPLALFLATRR